MTLMNQVPRERKPSAILIHLTELVLLLLRRQMNELNDLMEELRFSKFEVLLFRAASF